MQNPLVRGTFPFVLIGLGLGFLAWAKRSLGLAVIAALYLALALLGSTRSCTTPVVAATPAGLPGRLA